MRFPPWARIHRGREDKSVSRGLWAAYPIALAGLLGLLAVAGYRATGIERLSRPLSSMSAAVAYLFFLALLFSTGFVLAPGRRGAASRVLHSGFAVACIFPVLTLGLLARLLEPAKEQEIGSLWTTPSALYIAPAGGRGRRFGSAPERIDALLVEVRAPAFGVVWQGVKGFRSGGHELAWRGDGGRIARLLDRWAGRLENRGVFLTRSEQAIALSPNRRVSILSNGERVRFPAAD